MLALIDNKLWQQKPQNAQDICNAIENAIDNKLNNLIEETLYEYHNIEHL